MRPSSFIIDGRQWTISRWFDDGTVEFCFGATRQRAQSCVCVECERQLPTVCFETKFDPKRLGQYLTSALCHECRRACVDVQRDAEQARFAPVLKLQRLAKIAARIKRRSDAVSLASPHWRDRQKIANVYAEARRMTAETGIVHHVDHFYPLQGELCCGLHVHGNLRVLTDTANCSKSNSMPLDESPATCAFIRQYGASGLRVWIEWAKLQ